MVWSLQKSTPKRCQNVLEKNIEKNLEKIDLGLHFGFPKPPEILPKSFQTPFESDAERSLFRDAMETAPESAEVNGAQRL